MKKILALTLVLVMVLALCACGNSSKMAGTWELTAMTSDGEDYYATLKEYGITVILQLNEDGTGYLDVGGEKEDITWSGSSITIDGEKEFVKLNGDTLTIEEPDAVMTFTRK